MKTFDGARDTTDRDLVERVAATLELPRDVVDQAALQRWLAGLGTRDWALDERHAQHYRLRHSSSGCKADVLVLPVDPNHPRYPNVMADDTAQQPHLFSTVRLYGPAGRDVIADANLVTPRPDGSVSWVLNHPIAADDGGAGTDAAAQTSTTTANPFQRRALFARSVGGVGGPRTVALIAVGVALIGAAGLVAVRRSRSTEDDDR